MTRFGAVPALIVLTAVAAISIVAALRLWPGHEADEIEHTQDNLPSGHPHLQGQKPHSRPLVIDDRHPRWATHF